MFTRGFFWSNEHFHGEKIWKLSMDPVLVDFPATHGADDTPFGCTLQVISSVAGKSSEFRDLLEITVAV